MRTRDKLRVPVKVKCACGVRSVVGDATISVGTRIERDCKHCGAKIRKVITSLDLISAVKEWTETRDFEKRSARGEVESSTRVNYFRPKYAKKPVAPIAEETTRPTRKVRGDQVEGAAKLYHYAVYVKHPFGTDRIVVGVQERKIQTARNIAWDKVGRTRKTGDLAILDAVPMKWTTKGMVETRRTKVKTGDLKNVRRAKARVSVRSTNRNGSAPGPAKPAVKRRRSAKVEHVTVKTKKVN
jgi:hypothetical protein